VGSKFIPPADLNDLTKMVGDFRLLDGVLDGDVEFQDKVKNFDGFLDGIKLMNQSEADNKNWEAHFDYVMAAVS
jgi:hypothetical protein